MSDALDYSTHEKLLLVATAPVVKFWLNAVSTLYIAVEAATVHRLIALTAVCVLVDGPHTVHAHTSIKWQHMLSRLLYFKNKNKTFTLFYVMMKINKT